MIFDGKNFNKNIFYRIRKPFNLNDIDDNKTIISKEVLYGKKNSLKYFIVYNNKEDIIRPLLLKLPQMIEYLEEFDDSTIMSFGIDGSKLLKKYCKIWKKN